MKRILIILLSIATMASARAAESALPPVIDIPYERIVLKNGLTVLVHEDRKAPIVAFNIWYHVGSKNERPGRTGFAHLFEHLMFNGSENFNDDFFQAMERIGATDMNGTTSEDRTNYFEDAPKNALDTVLWMESDRMGHFAGAISQARLDEQRGVVQNEKRQGENEPYGKVEELITKGTWPANHPYSWTVIGSMEDLNAAALDDVKEWFKTYYGPANAVIVLAGDIDAQTARTQMEKYFGDIPSGPPVAHFEDWIAKRTGSQRQIMQDRVPQARLYKVWNVPAYRDEDSDVLELVADVLAAGKTSRLYQRLVYKEQVASGVQAFVDRREIAGQFQIVVTARPGQNLAELEKMIDAELGRLVRQGPTEDELRRVKTHELAGFIRGAERIGGFGGKSDILAMNQVFAGDPAHYKVSLQRIRSASAKQVQQVASRWLSDGEYVLEVHPFPELSAAPKGVDRSKVPEPGPAPDAAFPDLQHAALDNGLKIVLAERHGTPLVVVDLLVDSGYASDQFGIPGTAKLAMDMLDEGTKKRSALEISRDLDLLGATLATRCSIDFADVFFSALKTNLGPSLDIFGDVIFNPSFPEADFKRLQKLQLDAIAREKAQPMQMALRVFPELLYGQGHAYAMPMTGSGSKESVQRIGLADVRKFHETWFKPNNATVIVVGDVTMSEVKSRLEKLFGNWKPGTVPRKNISIAAARKGSAVYLMDRPGALQSTILAGELALPKANPDEIAIETMNNVLGGSFTSRINMNLREDKHWSYGAMSIVVDTAAQRPFIVFAPVQTDKTKESLVEIQKELRSILKDRPITGEELKKVQKQQTLQMAGHWETIGAVAGSIREMIQFSLPEDYFKTYAGKVRNLHLGALTQAAEKVVRPNDIVWVIVGDRSKIEKGIRELNLGEVHLIDADGRAAAE